MGDPARIAPLLGALQNAWQEAPDLRFGQLVDNIASLSGLSVLHSEDDAWLAAIEEFTDRITAVKGGQG